MRTTFWTAVAVVLAVSGAAVASDMSSGTGGGSNPASEKGVKTPKQPNESQPGMSAGTGDRKGKSDKAGTRRSAKGEMKSDTMSGGTGMKGGSSSTSGMGSGGSNMGNPAEKGAKTPSQPNESQPGMGGNKK